MRHFLLAVCLFVLPSQAYAVTYQASGMLSDGTTWSATAVFDAAAMADLMVDETEWTTFTVTTQVGALPAAEYDITEIDHGSLGFVFASATPGSAVVGSVSGEIYHGVDTVTGSAFQMTAGAVLESAGGSIPNRSGSYAGWSFAAVPEPLTATLIPLAVAPLLMRRRRAA